MHIDDSIREPLLQWALANHCEARPHDFRVGSAEAPYLLRWYVVRQGVEWLSLSPEERQRRNLVEDGRDEPECEGLNLYVHRFLRSDDDRALHDHPWPWGTLLLNGAYKEHLPADPANPAGPTRSVIRRAGDVVWRAEAERPHRVELLDGQPAVTLFLTGSRAREWGFWCEQGWVHWHQFVGHGCA